jgi:hypothetical protein
LATSFAKIIIRDLDKTVKDIEAEEARTKKAAETAVRRVSFNLMKSLKEEIRAGAPGGRSFAPLTEIAKRMFSGGANRAPLEKLAKPVRVRFSRSGNNFISSLGYLTEDILDPSIKSADRISKSWARIVGLHTEGGTIPVTDEMRRDILRWGLVFRKGVLLAGSSSRKMNKLARVFFLRPSTTTFKIPARPILEPFQARYQSSIGQNIISKFEQEMKGERI